ncbi:MAG TPA: 2OG-Fe(II) oxygenase family protein [Woeseiaceae bacterium]|nr:2OG-Fe(II) oxygenase family protein [Woeseiaceae bacterium]
MTGTIPVIDIANLEAPESLAAIDTACREWGFFQAVNHGIDPAAIAALAAAMRGFFAQPTNVKRRISRTADNPWGFYDQELTKNTRDWKEVYDFGPADDGAIVPQWPEWMPEFEPAVRNYYAQCERLAFRLLAALSLNLGLPAPELEQHFGAAHTSFLRLNYYPICPRPARPEGLATTTDGYLGVNHHTDAGVLTILLQDEQPGLEIFRHDSWHLVEPRSDALVVNIGDIVQVWSNDMYRASLHRVLTSPVADRHSAPYFLNPSYKADYAPLPSTVSKHKPARYCTINWGEFRARRAAGDYADYGEEVQISQYYISEP